MIKSNRVTLWLHSFSFSLLTFPSGPKWVTENRLKVRAQPTYLKVFPLKVKSLGALGDSGNKKNTERFILAFCHGFNLSYFCEQGPLGTLPMALDRAARTTKEESLLFIRPGLDLPGLRWPSIGRADKHKELLVKELTKQSSSVCQLPTVSTKTVSLCVSAPHCISCALNASLCHALHQHGHTGDGRMFRDNVVYSSFKRHL